MWITFVEKECVKYKNVENFKKKRAKQRYFNDFHIKK
jgi:hypothetical protein